MATIKKLSTKEKLNEKEYKELVNVTLARVLVFNAKRGGEIGRMQTDDYENVLERVWLVRARK